MSNESKYVSSIINQYGDVDNLTKDVLALKDILGRQGSMILVRALAENVGQCTRKFSLSEAESARLRDNLVDELQNAINERI